MSQFESLLSSLNPQQRAAVEVIDGAVLLIAGPGTGKTQVLAMRIAHILQNADVGPGNILCLTFTESGVRAMRERLHKIIGQSAYKVAIHTFHSFCNEVIQTFPDKFPQFRGNPQQLSDLQRIKLVRQLLDGLVSSHPDQKWELVPFHNPYQYQSEIINSIQTLKREGVSWERLTEFSTAQLAELKGNPGINKKSGEPTQKHIREVRSAQRNLELGQVYKRYTDELTARNNYDYEDMILFVQQCMQDDDELLSFYQEKYLYILVDEYQDTNGAQNQIIKLLGNFDPNPNIFAVGDDDQAIYRFQGANVGNLLFFTTNFPQSQVLEIGTNYRSTQSILDFATDSISHNNQRIANILPQVTKGLQSTQAGGVPPLVYRLETGDAELRYLVDQIQQLHAAGLEYKNIAVLYRRHRDGEDVIETLLQAGIPLKVRAGSNALKERPVILLLKLLRAVSQSGVERDRDLMQILLLDFIQQRFSIENWQAMQLIHYVHDTNWKAKSTEARTDILTEMLKKPPAEPLHKLAQQILSWHQLSISDGVAGMIAHLISHSGLQDRLLSRDTSIEELNAVNSFFNFVKDLNRGKPDWTLGELLQDIELLAENGLKVTERELDTDADAVNLMSAHGAKGLEFEHVFIVKCFAGNWGGGRSRQVIKLPGELINQVPMEDETLDWDLEDERRLFFVAATRAKSQLHISSAAMYASGNDQREVEESQFIAELATQSFQRADALEYNMVEPQDLVAGIKPNIAKSLTDVSAQERSFLQSLVSDFVLSASALNEYIECPLKFKFNRLLKIPLGPNEAVSLGNSVHKALELMQRDLMKENTIQVDQLVGYFEHALLGELLGGEQYKRVLTEGRDLLKSYFEYYEGNFPQAAALEYSFQRHNVSLELPDQSPIPLTGKVDKLEWVDMQNLTVKIVDYKTSSPKSENAIRGNTKDSNKNIWRQLVFYKILAELDPNFKPVGKLNKYKVESVEVDFVKPDAGKFRRVSLEILDQDVEDLKVEIAEVVAAIRALDFAGTGKFKLCGECEFCQLAAT